MSENKNENGEDVVWGELGRGGLAKVGAGFYRRVKGDDLIGPMYPEDDWEGSERRLLMFLCFRFGGEREYIEERGHPRLRGRHLPFRIGIKERDQWLKLMGQSLAENELSENCHEILQSFFAEVADFMRNQEEGKSGISGRGVDFGH